MYKSKLNKLWKKMLKAEVKHDIKKVKKTENKLMKWLVKSP